MQGKWPGVIWFSQERLTNDKKEILLGTIVSAEQTKGLRRIWYAL
jgi:hypothetical protein